MTRRSIQTKPGRGRHRLPRLAIMLAVVLAGCASTVAPTPAPIAQSTPSPTLAPTPTPTIALPPGICQIPDLVGKYSNYAEDIWKGAGFHGLTHEIGDGSGPVFRIAMQEPAYPGTTPCDSDVTVYEVVPTPAPTLDPNGPVEPTVAELAAACNSGAAIPEAASYGGTTHPNIKASQTGDAWQFWVRTDEVGDGSSSLEYYPGVLYNNGLEPLQLVVCHYRPVEGDQRSCGTYTSPDGTQTLDVSVLRMSETIRVVIAQTGETLEEKTFDGSLACPFDASQSTIKSFPDSDVMDEWVHSLTKTYLG